MKRSSNPSTPVPSNADRFAHIPGWGADLDHANRPAYPMERTPPRLPNGQPAEPLPQPPGVEVLHSIERPGLTPIYGTSVPPAGLSGAMRRLAFKYSENDLRHWLILLAADRVQVGEVLLTDLAHGRVPNIYREMGGPAELRHNPIGAARKAAMLGAGVLMLTLYWRRSRSRAKNARRLR